MDNKITIHRNDNGEITKVESRLLVRNKTSRYGDNYLVCEPVKALGYTPGNDLNGNLNELKGDIDVFFSIHSEQNTLDKALTNETFGFTKLNNNEYVKEQAANLGTEDLSELNSFFLEHTTYVSWP